MIERNPNADMRAANRKPRGEATLPAPACCAALTESMAHIANMGFCVVLKCLPDGFPWLDDEAKPICCKKWAAEASWVKHGDGYRMREHAIGDTPEEVVGKLETLIAAQSMRHNAAAHRQPPETNKDSNAK